MSPITSIVIAGVSLNLDDVEYSVSVEHGRNDVTSSPTPSSCQISVRGSQGVTAVMSDEVEVYAYGFDRFHGKISDLSITHLSTNPPTAVTTLTAMGNLATLGLRRTGGTGFPNETVEQRVETVLTDGGLSYLNGGSQTLDLHSVTGGDIVETSVLDALSELAEWSGATYFDTPEGVISFEAYGSRGLTAFAATWSAQTQDWDYYGQSWDSFPTSIATYTFPSSGVIWTPTWTQNLQALINDVTVTYGPSSNTVNSIDANSISDYGLRAYELTTGLDAVGDATARASNILTAQANPLWSLGQISVYVDALATPDRDRVMALINGATVTVPGLPAPAPFEAFQGIVEGWAETYTPDGHVITFSISDPRYSYQTVTWSGVDAALTWSAVDPAIIWYNVVNAGDLAA